jgi:hypothetical protein
MSPRLTEGQVLLVGDALVVEDDRTAYRSIPAWTAATSSAVCRARHVDALDLSGEARPICRIFTVMAAS